MKIIYKAFLTVWLTLFCSQLYAMEGAWSTYIPGTYGDFEVAKLKGPGVYVRNDMIFYDGKIEEAVLQGRLNRDLELDTFINVFNLRYITHLDFFGAKYGLALKAPYYNSDFKGHTSFDGNLFTQVTKNLTGLGDVQLIPLILNWTLNDCLYIELYEAISMPTGSYDTNRIFNIGRNHWAFDTNVAITWLQPQFNTEVSATIGYIRNTKNSDTEYLSGGEFHLDYNLAYFVTDNVGLGITGMIYDQVNGDEKNGAILGKLEAYSHGMGPSIRISFDAGPFLPLHILGKMIYEFETENRYKGKYWFLGVSARFF